MTEAQVPLNVGTNLVLRADPGQGRGADTTCTVQKVRGERVLVEVIVWGFVTRKQWVRLTELEEARWE
jgi:hypothetical protein